MIEFRLTRSQLTEMRAHVQACIPEEACGLLAGLHGGVTEVLPIRNVAASQVRFRMDPVEQLRAFEHIEAQGWQLLGIFHSHPAGPPRPSVTDVAEAAYDVVHLIWSPFEGEWQARGFLIHDGVISEVELYVADRESGSVEP